MAETQTLMLLNPVAFDLPDVRGFFTRALASSLQPDTEAEIEAIRGYVGSPYLHIIVTKAEEEFVGMAIVVLPATSLAPAPEVYHIYNEGSPQDRQALVHAVVAFVRAQGYSTLMTANLNGREKAFKRLFKSAGPATKVGVLYKFDLSEEDQWAASSEDYSEAKDNRPRLTT